MMVHFDVNAKMATQEMECNALTSMNAWQGLTIVIDTQFVQTTMALFSVHATMATQEMVYNALTLMNARQGLTTVINMHSVQTLLGHFSVNAKEGLLETEQPVKTSMNVFKRSIVTWTHIAQIRRDHLTVHASQALQGMAEAAKVNVMYINFGCAHIKQYFILKKWFDGIWNSNFANVYTFCDWEI